LTGFCVIGIYVDDIAKAVDFYCNKLGFEEAERYNDGCIVRLEHEGPTVILEEVKEPSKAKYRKESQVVLGIETMDVDAMFHELKSKGVRFIQDHPEPFVAGRFIALRDPAGNVLELLQFKEG
jgi:lactoylglutathione lyase